MLRIGRNEELKKDTLFFTPKYNDIIEVKTTIKDLGVLIDDNMTYQSQMNMAISKANKKLGWVLRTFRTRSIEFLRKLWNSLVQTHLDYCSVLWAGSANKTQRRALEGPLRSLTKAAWGLRNMSYWRRLKEFKLYCNEWQMEWQMHIYKSISGKAPSWGLIWTENSGSRSGHNLALPKLKGVEGRARGCMRNSIKYGSVKLFNSLPEEI